MTPQSRTAEDEHVFVFDLSTAQPYPPALVSYRDGALCVTTDGTAWAYAVLMPLLTGDTRRDGHVLKITAELMVTAGVVGIGVLNSAEDEFLTERYITVSTRPVVVELSVVPDAGIGRLVFRNTALGGTSSTFVVRRIAAEWTSRQWPVSMDPRNIAGEDPPVGGDTRVFDDVEATRINRARMHMIEAVDLPLAGARVLDVGCGVGRFEDFYLSRGCEVVAVDGRSENIAELQRRHPSVRAIVADVETFDLRALGRFDIVHCLGLLYHLENPLAALRNLHRVCDHVLLLETMVLDSALPMLLLADETKAVSQALGGIGCRPSPSFVAMSLNRIGFPRVYGLQPDGEHEDFEFEWRGSNEHTRDGHPLRCFFVASRHPLVARRLLTLVADTSDSGDAGGEVWGWRSSSRAFELDRHLVHDRTIVIGREPLVVRTPPEPWAYAVSFPAEWPHGSDSSDGVIRMRVRVLEGEISVLCLSVDGTRIIDETFVAASAGTVEATLVATPLTVCGRLVVRTGRAGGTAEVEIHSIDDIHLGAADQSDRLEPPRGLELKPVPDWSAYYGGRGESIEERLRSARYAALDRVKPMRWLEGLEVLIHPNDELSRALYISGTYEPASLLAMKRLLPSDGIFLDVGANVGLYSMLASRWVKHGQVFSFEPSEREFLRLRRHVELNGLGNITTIRAAVADRSGTLQLRVAEFPHAGHNTVGDAFVHDTVVAMHIEHVDGITLDRFASDARLERIDLVKVDVEGAEHAVLAGATKLLHDWRPSWIVEVLSETRAMRERRASEVLAAFYDASYRVFRLEESGALAELKPGDAISSGNVVAVPAERPVAMELPGTVER